MPRWINPYIFIAQTGTIVYDLHVYVVIRHWGNNPKTAGKIKSGHVVHYRVLVKNTHVLVAALFDYQERLYVACVGHWEIY